MGVGPGGSQGCFGSQHTPMSHQPYILTRQTLLNPQGSVPPEVGPEKPIPAQGRAQGRHSRAATAGHAWGCGPTAREAPRDAPSAHFSGKDTAEAE